MCSAVGPQQDPPRRAAGFDERVRLASLLERKRLRDDRLYLPALHQREDILELLARGARHRVHRLVLEEELGRIERHELAGELPNQDPAPGDAEAPAHRLEERRADVVDQHVDPAAEKSSPRAWTTTWCAPIARMRSALSGEVV